MFVWTCEIVCQVPRAISPWQNSAKLAQVVPFVGEVYEGTSDTRIIDHVQTFIQAKPKRWQIVFAQDMLNELPELFQIVDKVDNVDFILTGTIIDYVKCFFQAGIIICQAIIGWRVKNGVMSYKNCCYHWRKIEKNECESFNKIVEMHDTLSLRKKVKVQYWILKEKWIIDVHNYYKKIIPCSVLPFGYCSGEDYLHRVWHQSHPPRHFKRRT